MNYKNIDITDEILGQYATDGTYWMEDHCVVMNFEENLDNNEYLAYFEFDADNTDDEVDKNNSKLTRDDALNFLVCFLKSRFGNDSEYHIHTLWFCSDGIEDEFTYVLKAYIGKNPS